MRRCLQTSCYFTWMCLQMGIRLRVLQPQQWEKSSPKTIKTTHHRKQIYTLKIIKIPINMQKTKQKNYFTSSDPHHDMLGGGCQVRVVIKNTMGRMENLRTLISGFLGLVILVRWALVTMFLSWTTQTGCRIHRTYVSLIGSGEGRHTTHLLKCVLLLSTSQTDWKFFLTYLLTFFLTSFWHIFWHSFWQIFWHSFWHIFWHSFWHIFRHAFWHIFWHSFWHIKTKP